MASPPRSPGDDTGDAGERTTDTDAPADRSWLRSAGRRPTVGRGVRGRLGAVTARCRRLLGSIHAVLVGDPERYPVRGLIFVGIVSALVAFIGLFLIVAENLDPSAKSGPLVRTVVSLLTNFFAWAVLSVVGAIWVINRWWDRAAQKAAAETRYSTAVVKRLRQELTSTDGTVRLIGTREHSQDQLRAKLMRAFADQHASEQPGRDVDVSAPEAEVTGKALGGAPEAALPGNDDTVDASEADVDDLHDAADLPTALAHGSDAAASLGLVTAMGGYTPDPSAVEDLTLYRDAVARDPDFTLNDDGEVVLADDTDAERPGEADPDRSADQADTDASRDERGDDQADPGPATSFRQALQTFRMDIATSLNFYELLTRFALPAGATVLLTFTIAGTPWFAPWVYPIILAGATLVGTISYGAFKYRRRRKLRKLRREREPSNWPSCAVLAKRVETPEQTMYAAWMGGNQYADFDKQRLVETVADRWHQRLHGDSVAPAIQQKFAREIRHCRPLLHQFEYSNPREGRKGIEDDIIDVIREAKDPDGMVAKRSLAEQVVDRGPGAGHDPDLVAAVYQDLVPEVLTETEVVLEDTDGIERTMTAVHLRWMDLPDDMAQIRAQFANQFSADETATYDLPEVSATGPGTPRWADQLADLPTEGPAPAD